MEPAFYDPHTNSPSGFPEYSNVDPQAAVHDSTRSNPKGLQAGLFHGAAAPSSATPSATIDENINRLTGKKIGSVELFLKNLIGPIGFFSMLPSAVISCVQYVAVRSSVVVGSLVLGSVGFLSSLFGRGVIAAFDQRYHTEEGFKDFLKTILADTKKSAEVGGNLTGSVVGTLLAVAGSLVKAPLAMVGLGIMMALEDRYGFEDTDAFVLREFQLAILADSYYLSQFLNKVDGEALELPPQVKDSLLLSPLKEVLKGLKSNINEAAEALRKNSEDNSTKDIPLQDFPLT